MLPNSNEQKRLNFELAKEALESGITVMIVMLMLMVPRMSVSVPEHFRILKRLVRASAPCERPIGTVSRWSSGYKSEQSPEHGKTKYNTTFTAPTEFKCMVFPH